MMPNACPCGATKSCPLIESVPMNIIRAMGNVVFCPECGRRTAPHLYLDTALEEWNRVPPPNLSKVLP